MKEPTQYFLERLQLLLQNDLQPVCVSYLFDFIYKGDRASSKANMYFILAVSSRISQFKQDEEQLRKK